MSVRSFPRLADGTIPPAGVSPEILVVLLDGEDDSYNSAPAGSIRWAARSAFGFFDGTVPIADLADVDAWASEKAREVVRDRDELWEDAA
ncbi:hypothetical protein [Antarcticirhabdus aurantiaca]|uniref:hypothetical protein n=1 Tax=Antarcticirhabdus aurantiaca TaxID=2606717 RepID=UPI00131CA2C5|nr:hypothetical protein [Antarcticirhabdus aurantiaca]